MKTRRRKINAEQTFVNNHRVNTAERSTIDKQNLKPNSKFL